MVGPVPLDAESSTAQEASASEQSAEIPSIVEPQAAPAVFALEAQVAFFHNVFAKHPITSELVAILKDIKEGRWRTEIEALRELRAANPKGYTSAKRFLPCFCVSGTAASRTEPLVHSNLLQIDLDGLDGKLDEVRLKLAADPHIVFMFTSPSGVGLKLGVVIDSCRHVESFAAASAHFKAAYGLEIDPAVKDRLRLCFVSFDPHLVLREAALPIPLPHLSSPLPCSSPSVDGARPGVSPREAASESLGDEPDALQEALRCIPADDYATWIAVGMALHHWDHQRGLPLWDKWSWNSLKFKPGECQRRWPTFNGPRDGAAPVTIASIFKLAHGKQPQVVRNELPTIENAAALVADATATLPTEIVSGILHQGLKGILGSASKARKTWVLVDLALSISTGTQWWRWNTIKGRVLLINFEIPRAFIRQRIATVAAKKGLSDLSNLDVWNLRGHAKALKDLLPKLIERIKLMGYSLVIIDPIYKGLGGRDENAAGDIAEVCNEVEKICVETGAATFIAAHYSKGPQGSKASIDRISGSGVFGRDADAIICLTSLKKPADAYAVEITLRNLPDQPPFAVEWQYPLMVERPDLDPADVRKCVDTPKNGRPKKFFESDVLRLLTDPTGMRNSDWEAAAESHLKMSKTTFNELRRNLEATGQISKDPKSGLWLATAIPPAQE